MIKTFYYFDSNSIKVEKGHEISDPAAFGLFLWHCVPAASVDPLFAEVAKKLNIDVRDLEVAFSDAVFNLANPEAK